MDIPVSVLRAAAVALRVTPMPVADLAARALAAGISGLSADERKIAVRNLRRAGADLSGPLGEARAVQALFHYYGRYWVDTLRLPNLSTDEIERGLTIEGFDHVDRALGQGPAPIFAMPHLGGWEWAARWMTDVKGYSVAAVVEEIEPPEMFEWFKEVREQMGVHVIALSEGATAVAAALAAGEVMCLLCDRDLSGNGIEVEFFDERTTLPGGPALIALRTGAPLLPAAVYFRGSSSCHAVVDEPLDTVRRGRLRDDVTRVTQDLAHAMERQIRRAPMQWHLLQPNWPSDYEALGQPAPGSGGHDRDAR